jgi:hypothetical protein
MEHPEADLTGDGIAELFDRPAREEPSPRALGQVLLIVVGWLVVIAIAAVALVVAAPAIQAFVVGVVQALRQ